MSKPNTTPKSNPAPKTTPKRRGRAKGSTIPVTLEIAVKCSDVERMSLRFENAIDDGSADVVLDINTTDDGFTATVNASDGGNGRVARQTIAKTLKKWIDKGRVQGASILTNPIRLGNIG